MIWFVGLNDKVVLVNSENCPQRGEYRATRVFLGVSGFTGWLFAAIAPLFFERCLSWLSVSGCSCPVISWILPH